MDNGSVERACHLSQRRIVWNKLLFHQLLACSLSLPVKLCYYVQVCTFNSQVTTQDRITLDRNDPATQISRLTQAHVNARLWCVACCQHLSPFIPVWVFIFFYSLQQLHHYLSPSPGKNNSWKKGMVKSRYSKWKKGMIDLRCSRYTKGIG